MEHAGPKGPSQGHTNVTPARSSRPRIVTRTGRDGVARSSSAPGRPSRPFWTQPRQWGLPEAAAAEDVPDPDQEVSPRTAFLSDAVLIDRFVSSGLLSRKLRGWLASYIEMRRGDLARIPPGCLEEPSPEDEQVLLAKLATLPIPPGKPRARRRRLLSSDEEEEQVEAAQAKRPCQTPALLPATTTTTTTDFESMDTTAATPAPPTYAAVSAGAVVPPLHPRDPRRPRRINVEAAEEPQPGPSGMQRASAPAQPTAPTPRATAAPPSAAAPASTAATTAPPSGAPKTPRYPPIVVESLPNWATHLRNITASLGRQVSARAYGTGVRFSPQDEVEYRAVDRYLRRIQEEGVEISWFSYSPESERSVKVAVRGLPVNTTPEELMTALRDRGYDPEFARPIRARKGRPGCIFLVILRKTENLTPGIYAVKELLYMPGVTIEAWRSKRGPAQCHRCQGFRHSSHNCHRPLACVRCGESHATADCPRPRDAPAICANCAGPHPANHSSCPVLRREARNKKAGPIARTTTTQQQPQQPRAAPNVRPSAPAAPPAPVEPVPRGEAPSTGLMAAANNAPATTSARRNRRGRSGKKRSRTQPPRTATASVLPAGPPAHIPQAPAHAQQRQPERTRAQPPTSARVTSAQRSQPNLPEPARVQTSTQLGPASAQLDPAKRTAMRVACQVLQSMLAALEEGADPIPIIMQGLLTLAQQ
ncbi:uncharacterized protein LOC123692706 [Colias croceus]|uniref:uncharacterized protein LOC123692706 n=1 Tax=Colias crocea TaxID=72248 RepID=UPI001E27F1E8|nr:uncharacterized protein LOC123692706 [Colias croceus]